MAERPSTFPDFCEQDNLYSVFLIAELVVLVLVLSPMRIGQASLWEVGVLSLFAQLVALSAAAFLCGMRPRLERIPPPLAFGASLALILAVTALATVAGRWLDGALDLNVVNRGVPLGRLVAGNLAVVALVAAAGLRYFHVQHLWRRDVEARAAAQTQALQARIRPHFLFNALNTIATLTRKDGETAERAVEDLSDLFRASLVDEDGPWTLADEEALCRRYARIEALRLGSRLRFAWDFEALPARTPFPRLMLQPLVENAVLHGIQQLREGGTVAIRGGVDEGGRRAWIEVRNPRPAQAARRRHGSGVALINIRERLMLRYGARAKLDTHAEREDFVARLTWPLEAE